MCKIDASYARNSFIYIFKSFAAQKSIFQAFFPALFYPSTYDNTRPKDG